MLTDIEQVIGMIALCVFIYQSIDFLFNDDN